MNRIAVAILWELWRLCRREWLLRVGGQSLMLVLLFIVAWQKGDITVDGSSDFSLHAEPTQRLFAGIALMIIVVSSCVPFALGTSDDARLGFPFRLGFTRPVSTAALVGLHFVFFATASASSFALCSLLFRVLFRYPLSLAAPAVAIGAFVICLLAAIWSTSSYAIRVGGVQVVIALGVMGVVLIIRQQASPDPLLMAIGDPELFRGDWWFYGVPCFAAVAAYCVSVHQVDRQRHGQLRRKHWPMWQLRPAGRDVVNTEIIPRARPLGGAWSAQLWFELRRGAYRVLVVSAVVTSLVWLVLSLTAYANPNWKQSHIVWLWLLAISPIVYQMLGIDWTAGITQADGVTQLSTFDALRPIRSDQIVVIKVLVVTGVSALGWLMTSTGMAIQLALAGENAAFADLRRSVLSAASALRWYDGLLLAAAGIAVWIVATSTILGGVLWFARYRRVTSAGVVLAWLLVSASILERVLGRSFAILWTGCQLAMLCFMISTALVCLWLCIRRRTVGRPYLIGVLAVWAVLQVAVWRVQGVLPPQVLVAGAANAWLLGVSLATTPITALCLTPLAFSMHRHR